MLSPRRDLVLLARMLTGHPLRFEYRKVADEDRGRARAILRSDESGHCLHWPGVEGLVSRTPLAGPSMSTRVGLPGMLHALAHLQHGSSPQPPVGLKPLQRILYGVLEDSRVESLAMTAWPGLRAVLSEHFVRPGGFTPGIEGMLEALAAALFDPARPVSHPWVARVLAQCQPVLSGDGSVQSSEHLRDLASRLGHELGQMRLGFDHAAHAVWPAYRDDNGHLWQAEPVAAQDTGVAGGSDQNGGQLEEASRQPPAPEPVARLREWDYLISRYRESWCTVYEEGVALARSCAAVAGRRTNTGLLLNGRPLDAGGQIDPELAVAAWVSRRRGESFDTNIFRERGVKPSAFQLDLLLDLSASTLDSLREEEKWFAGASRRRDLILMAAGDLAGRFEGRGHVCTATAFHSDTRHRIEVRGLKATGEAWGDPVVQRRLNALQPRGSTRMGAAIRHLSLNAGTMQQRRTIMLLTDGEPHDIDVHDHRYLVEDLVRAIAEARQRAIPVLLVMVPAGKAERADGAGQALRRASGRLPLFPVARAKDLHRLPGWVEHRMRAA